MWIGVALVTAFTQLLIKDCHGIHLRPAERTLHDDLFSNYDKHLRPVGNYTDVVEVKINLSLTQILDVDEKNQIMTTSCWVQQAWQDYQLMWDPADYFNISYVIVPYDWVWRPDVVVDNSANGKYQIPPSQYLTVEFDGWVYYTPPAIIVTPCTMDIEYFPSDVQHCEITFGPWEYTDEQVILLAGNHKINKEKYTNNTEWDFIYSNVFMDQESSECCPGEIYSLLRCEVTIKRRPLYYTVNIIVPCCMMSALTLLVFCLPPDSGEKISFSMSLLIASSVFNLMVADIMPATSDTVPMLIRYLLFNTSLVALSILVSVVVLRLHHRPPYNRRLSGWKRKFFLKILPKILYMKERKILEHEPLPESAFDEDSPKENGTHCNFTYAKDGDIILQKRKHLYRKRTESDGYIGRSRSYSSNLNSSQVGLSETTKHMQELSKSFRYFIKKLARERFEKNFIEEWKYFATVVDRIFVWLALIAFVVAASTFLTQTDPHLNM
ncbi:neuronal acetylcholine receptor subunit alpha-6-like [Glandiceps talaboti]